MSIIDSFPLSHYEKVQAVPGVNAVVHLNWFGGVYKDGKAQIPVFPINVDEFFKVYPEVKITPEELAAWKADRQGMVIGQVLADTYGWKKGDRVPIKSSHLPQGRTTATPGNSTSSASTRWRTAPAGTTRARCSTTTTTTSRCCSGATRSAG